MVYEVFILDICRELEAGCRVPPTENEHSICLYLGALTNGCLEAAFIDNKQVINYALNGLRGGRRLFLKFIKKQCPCRCFSLAFTVQV